jgi:signal peptidase I
MFYTDKSYYKPIDKKTNYVKRAVGIAGDTLEIIDGYVYINGEKNILPDRAKLQFSYLVQPKKYRFTSNDMINNYDITDGFGIPQTINGGKNLNNTYYFAGISESSASKLKNHPNVSSVKRNVEEKGVRGNNIFPHDKSYNWNSDFYGPIYIPKKNSSIPINKSNISVYKRLIEVYENNKLEIDGDRIVINDKEISEYKFKQDYYWLMGDNRGNSQDSRAWGFVPFDHVVGKPIFKWLSIDYNAKGLDKIRWERMFTSVHGKGVPTSYFPHFIIIIILYYLFSFLYKKYKK